uniref:Uncharacterized protein n=1 Tax=uncultured Desulfobacterium sp. TaxID=201089 RepID=E1Y7Z5_9BACT|nr:unknown protein [uncultured Desulfobacterium sp.]
MPQKGHFEFGHDIFFKLLYLSIVEVNKFLSTVNASEPLSTVNTLSMHNLPVKCFFDSLRVVFDFFGLIADKTSDSDNLIRSSPYNDI